jgi:hypothetical protein
VLLLSIYYLAVQCSNNDTNMSIQAGKFLTI